MTWKISNGRFLLIEMEAWEKMESHRQLSSSFHEAGGILLGSRRGPHIHIVDITLPMASDVRGRYSFERISPKHRKYALNIWKKSDRKISHVGEWHTHPEKYPTPSFIDRMEMRKVASLYKPNDMISIILGTVGVDIRVYCHRKKTIQIGEPVM